MKYSACIVLGYALKTHLNIQFLYYIFCKKSCKLTALKLKALTKSINAIKYEKGKLFYLFDFWNDIQKDINKLNHYFVTIYYIFKSRRNPYQIFYDCLAWQTKIHWKLVRENIASPFWYSTFSSLLTMKQRNILCY